MPDSKEIIVSIVLCTCSNPADVEMTLKAILSAIKCYGVGSEVIVCDNSPTLKLSGMINALASAGDNIRHVGVITPGLSVARNHGVRSANGKVILFTDDDIRVPSNWIHLMCDEILSGKLDAVAGGVNIAPHLRKSICIDPRYFADNVTTSATDARSELTGANMAISRHVFESVGEFDEELGAGRLGFHEESLFSKIATQKGFRIGFKPDVAVEHHLNEERLTRKSMLRMAEKIGKSDAYIAYHFGIADATMAWYWLIRLAIMLWLRRLFSPRMIFRNRSADWEISKVRQINRILAMRVYRGQARKYCDGA